MNHSFIWLAEFIDRCRRLKLIDDDIRELESMLDINPDVGQVIAGAGGVRKLRFSPSRWHRGKSGATRVCYLYYQVHSLIVFVTVYAKNEQANLTPDQKKYMQRLSAEITRGLPETRYEAEKKRHPG